MPVKPISSVLLTGEGTGFSTLSKVHGVILVLAHPARPAEPRAIGRGVDFRPRLGRPCGQQVPLWGGGEQWFEPKGPLSWTQFLRTRPGF